MRKLFFISFVGFIHFFCVFALFVWYAIVEKLQTIRLFGSQYIFIRMLQQQNFCVFVLFPSSSFFSFPSLNAYECSGMFSNIHLRPPNCLLSFFWEKYPYNKVIRISRVFPCSTYTRILHSQRQSLYLCKNIPIFQVNVSKTDFLKHFLFDSHEFVLLFHLHTISIFLVFTLFFGYIQRCSYSKNKLNFNFSWFNGNTSKLHRNYGKWM